MGTNPMQKMKRNSMLTGLTIGLVVGLLLCLVVYLALTSGKLNLQKGTLKTVQVLSANVKSGETITMDKIAVKNVSAENVPADAVAISPDTQVVSKIDLTAGTILTSGMLNLSGEKITADLREQEYNMITLPTTLTVGDFIDIRLQLPNGGDYIVIPKKQVINCNSTTVWLKMYEEEMDLMSNAIIEYYIMTGSKLYATTYTEPGLQTAAVGTYVPNETVSTLISSNPNIKSYINSERYLDSLKALRNNSINAALAAYQTDRNENKVIDSLENTEEKIQKEIKSLKEAREAYFGALNAAN